MLGDEFSRKPKPSTLVRRNVKSFLSHDENLFRTKYLQ